MKEMELLAKLYEETLDADIENAVTKAKTALRQTPVPQRRKGARGFAFALSSCVIIAVLSISMLLVFLGDKGGDPVNPPYTPPIYYSAEKIERVDIDAETLKIAYSDNLNLTGFYFFSISLYHSIEEPHVSLYLRLNYAHEQEEDFPASLFNGDSVAITILLVDNVEYKTDMSFEDDKLEQRLNYSIDNKSLEVWYHDDWNEDDSKANARAKFAFNGRRYFIETKYMKIPGFTTDNMIRDIVEQLFNLI